jgi:hypothetical protein
MAKHRTRLDDAGMALGLDVELALLGLDRREQTEWPDSACNKNWLK